MRRTNSSASQTLSDLAAAASNQLMVENAAAAAAATSGKSPFQEDTLWGREGSWLIWRDYSFGEKAKSTRLYEMWMKDIQF